MLHVRRDPTPHPTRPDIQHQAGTLSHFQTSCSADAKGLLRQHARPCRIPVGVPVALRSKSRSCLSRCPGRSVVVSTSLSYSGRCIARVSVSVPVSRGALSGQCFGQCPGHVPVSGSAGSGRVVSRSCRDPFSPVFWLMCRSRSGQCPGGVLVVSRSCRGQCSGRIPVGVSAGVPVVSWSLLFSFRGRRSGPDLVPFGVWSCIGH